MAFLTYHKNSPYYLIRYYDKNIPDPKKKRVTTSTKILITKSDLERIKNSNGKKVKLLGNREVNSLLRRIEEGLIERNLKFKSNIIFRHQKTLSQGFEIFKREKTVPGDSEALKPGTMVIYRLAKDHFVNVCGDKYIDRYTKESDYYDLLGYFEAKDMGMQSRGIYTRALKSLWNYFISKGFASENIIKPIKAEDNDPQPIPINEMRLILNHFKKNSSNQYHFIKLVLLTGTRPSSMMVQRKEWIDLKKKEMKILNVKARKKKKMYKFPIYPELMELLEEIDINGEGRLFECYTIGKTSYVESLKFWSRTMKLLKKEKAISKRYLMRQLRPTFASYLVNELNIDISTVKELLNHTDIKITDQHYVSKNIAIIREKLGTVKFEDSI